MDKQILTDNQEKWLTALESGKYEQTYGILRSIEKHRPKCYCALGVAYEIVKSKPKHGISKIGRINYDLNLTSAINRQELSGTDISNYLKKHFKDNKRIISSADPCQTSIICLNDTFKLTFKQIAQVIRKFPHVYFKKAKPS